MKNLIAFVFFFSLNISAIEVFNGCNQAVGAKENEKPTTSGKASETPYSLSQEFKDYWYAGKAEISSYRLKQARYGEIHDGSAVMVFVTEDFSKSKQVKLDHPEKAGDDKLPVLKLNLAKKFVTGIYPYSMMMSAFSPVDINNYPHAVKTATSVQEWCGSTFTQINNREGKYEVQWNSYFEDEGDQRKTFPEKTTSMNRGTTGTGENCWLEDEVWNLIRIAPDRLPAGEQKILPGSLYTRMTHIPLTIQTAKFTLKEDGDTEVYTISYTKQQHTINVRFEKNFPHKILGWEEIFPGFDGKLLTTTATLDKTLITDYWNHHKNEDRAMRNSLDLPIDF